MWKRLNYIGSVQGIGLQELQDPHPFRYEAADSKSLYHTPERRVKYETLTLLRVVHSRFLPTVDLTLTLFMVRDIFYSIVGGAS